MHDSTLRDAVGPGYVGPLYCGEREILRRIFVTVRDRQWREIAPTQWDSTVDESGRGAIIKARHSGEGVDFEWQGRLQVDADRRVLSFAFEGRALRDMEVCRLGLIVLHSAEAMVGARLTAAGPHGEQRLTVASDIHPQPIVHGVPGAMTEPFSRLRIERADVGMLELKFDGDVFELEDQRNWGDASFKTYCTPLRLGFPRQVKAGTTIAHGVEACFTPAQAGSHSSHTRVDAAHDQVTSGMFPNIGREWSATAKPDRPGTDGLAWHHLRLEAEAADTAGLQPLFAACTPLKIELAIEARDHQPPAAMLLDLLQRQRSRIARLLLYGAGTAPPTASALDGWRRTLDAYCGADLPLFAATRGYYVEFNRAAPLDAPLSGIAFPLTATVHSDDAATVIDNVATIGAMARTARGLIRPSQLALAPLALYHPAPTGPRDFPQRLVAPWLTATLIQAAAAHIASVTLAQDLLRAIAALEPGTTEPFLSRLIECAGREALPLDSIPSPGLHAVRLQQTANAPASVLAANLARAPAALDLGDKKLRPVKAHDALNGAALAVEGSCVRIPPFAAARIELELR